MNVAVVINPVAGVRGRGDMALARIALATRLFGVHGLTPEIVVTERRGHGFEVAQALVRQGVSLVVAWGGDGTVNEVGRALAFGDAALAIVPAGSGNGLARALGIARRPFRAVEEALVGEERRIDVGELDGHLFFNVAGVGFDAHVARLFGARARRGLVPYVTIALRELFSYVPADYTISMEGEVVRTRAMLVALANGQEFGGRAAIAPHARLDDGRLELVAIAARRVPAALWELPRLYTGTIGRARGVLMRSVQDVSIASDRPVPFHVDGEPGDDRPQVRVRVHPGALRVRVPRGELCTRR